MTEGTSRPDPAEQAQEQKQRLRIQRLTLAIAASAVTVGITLLVVWAGYLPLRAGAIYTGLVALLCVLSYAAIRSGLTRRLSDPSLTVPQLVAAGLAVSYVAFEGAAARPAFMAMYFIAYMFGVFALGPRGLVGIAVFYLSCYVGVVSASILLRPAVTDIDREMFRIVVLALVLGWMTVLGSYISTLRQSLRQSNEQLKQALARAEARANDDGLTGCNNHRRMMELLAIEAKRAERGSPLSVCLVDLDHFKDVNDDHGHLSGDEVLKRFAGLAQATLRATDFLARYGGEEFLIGLSQTALPEAALVAERIRRAMEECAFPPLPSGRRVTVSIGVAEHHPSDTIDRTLSRVDAALYEAKHQGRNRIVCAS